MIKFACENCRKKIGVQDDYAGMRLWCPQCGARLAIPKAQSNNTNNPNDRTQYSVFICHEHESSQPASESYGTLGLEPENTPTVPVLPIIAHERDSSVSDISLHLITVLSLVALIACFLVFYWFGAR